MQYAAHLIVHFVVSYCLYRHSPGRFLFICLLSFVWFAWKLANESIWMNRVVTWKWDTIAICVSIRRIFFVVSFIHSLTDIHANVFHKIAPQRVPLVRQWLCVFVWDIPSAIDVLPTPSIECMMCGAEKLCDASIHDQFYVFVIGPKFCAFFRCCCRWSGPLLHSNSNYNNNHEHWAVAVMWFHFYSRTTSPQP